MLAEELVYSHAVGSIFECICRLQESYTYHTVNSAAEALSVLKTTADSMLCEGVTDHVTPIKVSTACTVFVCTVLSF